MTYLYLWLNIGSLAIPFIFSFHPKLQFYKKWRSLFPGILLMMAIFISWDILFTNKGIWGFNEAYISGFKIFNLPVEEWLFFVCIPYSCVFTHYALLHLFPKLTLSNKVTSMVFVTLTTILIITLLYNYHRWYTAVNFGYAILILGIVFNKNRELLNRFFLTFVVILVPFFVINGVLTGTGITDEVVWYNNSENLDIRLFTIPIEDVIYTLGMLLTVLAVMDWLEKKKSS